MGVLRRRVAGSQHLSCADDLGPRGLDVLRAVRLARPDPDSTPLTFVLTRFPGIAVAAKVAVAFCRICQYADALAGAVGDAGPMSTLVGLEVDDHIERVDWEQAKADLAADRFDNGRSAAALRKSFVQSQHVAFGWLDDRVVGMARLLSDGVCNAYLLDVWTHSAVRRRGIASTLVRHLIAAVPGQHIGLQTDDADTFYRSLGFMPQPQFMSFVVGQWLDNVANRPPSGARRPADRGST